MGSKDEAYGAWSLLAVDSLFVNDAFQSSVFDAAIPIAQKLLSELGNAENAIRVDAAKSWAFTKIKIQRGQRISISASGEVYLGNGNNSGPNGISLSDDKKPMASCSTGSLIAVIGDDNEEFICIGKTKEFIASRDGMLFLNINESKLDDNNGAFIVQVKILPKP